MFLSEWHNDFPFSVLALCEWVLMCVPTTNLWLYSSVCTYLWKMHMYVWKTIKWETCSISCQVCNIIIWHISERKMELFSLLFIPFAIFICIYFYPMNGYVGVIEKYRVSETNKLGLEKILFKLFPMCIQLVYKLQDNAYFHICNIQ